MGRSGVSFRRLDRRLGVLLLLGLALLAVALTVWIWRGWGDGDLSAARAPTGDRVARSHGRSLYVAPRPSGDVDWTVVAQDAQTAGTLAADPAGGLQTTVRSSDGVTWLVGRTTLPGATAVDVEIGGARWHANLMENGVFFLAVDGQPGEDDVVFVRDDAGRVLVRVGIL